MKTRRFFSVFLLLVLTVSLSLVPAAAAEEDGGVSPPELHCDAMLLVDAHTGQTVYGKNEHQEMYPASLTKIMTALLVLEAVDDGRLSLDQSVTATESALAGLAAGYWSGTEDIRRNWAVDRTFTPSISPAQRDEKVQGWRRAVQRAFDWARE